MVNHIPYLKGCGRQETSFLQHIPQNLRKKLEKTLLKPFIGGGHLKLGRTDDREAAISADIRYCTARVDSDIREDEFIITEGNMSQSPYAFWIFYDNPSETERMKYLSRLDPERDIDWEKIKPESTQYKIAKALCKYKEVETFPKKYFYTK